MDRITLIKAVSRNLADLVVDTTPASLSGSYIDANELIHPLVDQLRGYHFYIYSGAGNGQSRVVGSFDPTYNRIGFPQSLGSVPSINSNFILTKYWRKADYDNALDRTLGRIQLQYLEDKVATLQLVGSQYEYVVPSGFEYIHTLRLVPTGDSDYEADDETARIFELPQRYWRIEMNPLGSKIVAFDARKIAMDTVHEQYVRIMGQTKITVGTADTSTIPAKLEEYLIAGSSMLLSSQRISEDREWQSKFGIFRDMANALEPYAYTPKRGKQI